MASFIGNTSSSATYNAMNQPATIVSFSLANKTGGSITASVGILYGSTFYVIYNKSISTGDSYVYSGNPVPIPTGYQVYIFVSDSCDYIFNIQ